MKKLFLATVLAVLASGATAQVSDTLRVQTITVSAIRASDKTPVAHSDLDREAISRLTKDVGDVPSMLTGTPSVVATSDAGTGIGYTSVSIRGTDGTRINVTANGIPLGDAEEHKLYWVNTPDIAASAGSIQIQRGVGTSTNGAGAFGGSINITTEPLSPTPFAEIAGSYGSFNTHRESIRFGTGQVGRWAFGGRLTNIGSDGYVDRASADMKSYFVQGGWFGRTTTVKLLSFGGHEATYHAWNGVTKEQMKEFGRTYNSAGEIRPGVYYPDQKDFYTQYNFQLIVDQRLSNRWNLNVTGHYTRGDGYYEEYKDGRTLMEYGLEGDESNLVRRKKMWNDFGGLLASATFDGERLDAVFGAAFNRYSGDHFGQVTWVENYAAPLDPLHEYYRNSSAKNDLSAFAKASWEIAEGLNLWGDVQFRHIDHRIDGANDTWDWINGRLQALDVARVFNFVNPKVGAHYTAGHHSIYASLGIAHKEPTRDNYTNARFDVEPRHERLTDWEAGYEFSGRRVTAGVNLYYMKYKDQLVPTGEVNDIGELLAENIADSYRAGVEIEASWRVAEWLTWRVFATFSRNRVDEHDLAYSPDVVAGNIFELSFGKFRGALQTNYVGAQYVTNAGELKLPDYCVTTLRAGYDFGRVELGVTVNNLFDARYSSFGYDWGGGQIAYFPQAGANFIGNVTLRF